MKSLQEFEERHRSAFSLLFYQVLMLGLGVRFYQFLMGRSLWEDEAHMALNFLSRDFEGILQPLDYIQAGPPLFLLTVEAITSVFGEGEQALRALPFLANVLTFPLFYYLLLALTKSRIAAILGFLPFAVNLAVVYYSSELKTYGVDVAVFVLLTYLVVSDNGFVAKRRNFLLGVAGCLSLLYSNVAFILLFSIGCYVLLDWIQNKRVEKGKLWVFLAWALVFFINYFLFIHDHPYEAIQRANYVFGFPPMPVFGVGFNAFMETTLFDIGLPIMLYVSNHWALALCVFALVAIAIGYAIYKGNYRILLLTCLPIAVHFTLALFHIYPFWYRLILYFVPAVWTLLALGSFRVVHFLAQRVHVNMGVGMAVLCSFFFSQRSIAEFPLYYREIRPVLHHINQHHPDKFVYITTPYTLYKYYQLRGHALDTLYEGLDWNNGAMKPETFYQAVEGSQENYLLLHAENPEVDSFHLVLADLKSRGLIVNQFTHMSYTLSEVKPLNPDNSLVLNYRHFPPDKTFDLNGKKVVPIWAYDVTSNPVAIQKGRYTVSITAAGTPAAGQFPHLNLYLNDSLAGSFFVSEEYKAAEFPFEHSSDEPVVFKVIMDNDAIDATSRQDRNAFIHSLRIRKAD